MIDFDE
jgi:5'-AMP-activated protein kinase, catalytic alpha subunit